MAVTLQQAHQLFFGVISDVGKRHNTWPSLLSTAARSYKYSLLDQIMIYAQHPSVTACMSLRDWNKKMGRYVRSGSKGIALINQAGDGLQYVFDVLDTDKGIHGRELYLWQMRNEHYTVVRDSLIESYGQLDNPDNIAYNLLDAAERVVNNSYKEYLDDLNESVSGSYLEGLNKDTVHETFRNLLTCSVQYMTLVRCDIDPSPYFDGADFKDISQFNSADTFALVGNASNRLSYDLLHQIELSVKRYDREQKKLAKAEQKNYTEVNDNDLNRESERGEYYGNDIQRRKRLSNTESASIQPGHRQIRQNEVEIPQGKQESQISANDDWRHFGSPPTGSQPTGPSDDGRGSGEDSDGNRRERGTESPRSNGVGRTDERNPSASGRSHPERIDLQLNSREQKTAGKMPAVSASSEYQQTSLFDSSTITYEHSGPTVPTSSGKEKKYDLGYGYLGNGLTVWNRLEEENGEYKTVAHITADRTVTYYDHGLPEAIQDQIKEIALSSDATISETQDVPGFSTPAQTQLLQKQTVPEIPEIAANTSGLIEGEDDRLRSIIIDLMAKSSEPEVERQNFHITDDHLGVGGLKTKYGFNIAAIRILKQIENRPATIEEQEILHRYVGWGGIPQAFDERNEQWTNEYEELKALLTPEEYAAARRSTLNAHYTSPVIIKAMYEALVRMGVKAGNIIDPGCGVGNFFGLLPEEMQDSKMYGVELDSITGRIAQQLYPKADITITGFENKEFSDNLFDCAVGNVPFGEYKLDDPRYDKHNFYIHDYFFAKALDKIRPGGIVAFITSKGTLDKKNPSVRKYLAQRADLLGAVRLPNNAFKANANTEVTTDILFLQKRDRPIEIEPDWVHLGMTEDGIPVNSYYVDHPEMMLGHMAFDKSMYGNEKETACLPIDGSNLADQLRTALSQIKLSRQQEFEIDDELMDDDEDADEADAWDANAAIPADPNVRNFSYTVVEDKLYYRENSVMSPVAVGKIPEERIRGMIELRNISRALIDAQLENSSDISIHSLQNQLNQSYDRYTQKYGLLNSLGNKQAFELDSSYPLLCSLEVLDDQGNLNRKADMFTKRTIQRPHVITSVDTASDALTVSIGEKACVDLGYMSSLMGHAGDIEPIIQELRGVIFKDPMSGTDPYTGWQTADEYLSGYVRRKLEIAKSVAEANPDFTINVDCLTQAQPKDLTATEIEVHLGAQWVECKYYTQFVHELLHTPVSLQNYIQVQYSKHTGEWKISEKALNRGNDRANIKYGSKRASAYRLIEDCLNQRDTQIYDTHTDVDGKEIRVLNATETAIARDKQGSIHTSFREWIFKDQQRRETLVNKYNQIYNAIRPRQYDGQHIRFDGMNPEIKLRPHQRNGVARILYGDNTLLGHCVGSGKTYTMIAGAMESKRLGIANKSLFCVPNHLTQQWASDFLKLYPGSNILVASKRDFKRKNRKKFCARIATGDYDAVIMGFSQFQRIPLSPERQEVQIRTQINELEHEIAAEKEKNGTTFSVKQMEKMKLSLENQLSKFKKSGKKDDVITFEQLGIDRLFIDEADNYKNLYVYTKMRNVAGVGQTDAQKSSDMFMKCQYMDEITGKCGITFATGTPISNSITELYTMMRYLQYSLLVDMDLLHFDSWAAQFGEKVSAMELAPEGTGYRMKTRLARFFNLPELISMWKESADIVTADMLPDLPKPKVKYTTVKLPASEPQKIIVDSLADRAEEVRAGNVEPTEDNMLKITNDGRKLALEERLIFDQLVDDATSKVNACVDNAFQSWQETGLQKSAQLIFCDLSTPHFDGKYNVYDDVRNKLIAKGVPAHEIVFIHEAKSDRQKEKLFAKVRSGQVRFLLGSTQMMGAGTNVQDRLIKLHHLDPPWKPRDVGRILRTFKIKKNVEVTDNGKIII